MRRRWKFLFLAAGSVACALSLAVDGALGGGKAAATWYGHQLTGMSATFTIARPTYAQTTNVNGSCDYAAGLVARGGAPQTSTPSADGWMISTLGNSDSLGVYWRDANSLGNADGVGFIGGTLTPRSPDGAFWYMDVVQVGTFSGCPPPPPLGQTTAGHGYSVTWDLARGGQIDDVGCAVVTLSGGGSTYTLTYTITDSAAKPPSSSGPPPKSGRLDHGFTCVDGKIVLDQPAAAPCVVPNVLSMTLSAARRALRASHCTVGRVAFHYSTRVKAGRVLAQQPTHGARPTGSKSVSLTLSRGKPKHHGKQK